MRLLKVDSSRRLRRSTAITAVAALVLAVLGIVVAPPAHAATQCSYSGGKLTIMIDSSVTVFISHSPVGLPGVFQVTEITNTPAAPDPAPPVGGQVPTPVAPNAQCDTGAGPARLDNVGLVEVNASGGGNSSQTLVVDTTNGPFAPGAPPVESDGVPEIEFEIDLSGGDDAFRLVGSAGPDSFRAGTKDGFFQINGNFSGTDSDADFKFLNAMPVPPATTGHSSVETVTLEGRGNADNLGTQGGGDMTGAVAPTVAPDPPASGGVTELRLMGGAGADTMTGIAGTATLIDYSDSPAPVTIDLREATLTDGGTCPNPDSYVCGDKHSAVAGVVGSPFDDLLIGRSTPDTLKGGDGNDVLRAGPGPDTLAGQGGSDTADYSDHTTFVTVDLNDASASSPGPNSTQTDGISSNTSDTYSDDIENVIGTQFNDTLKGDRNANVLTGLGGNDTLIGRDGSDRLAGGPGDDILAADTYTPAPANSTVPNNDIVDYSGSATGVTVDLTTLTAQNTGEGTDTLHNFESIWGSHFNDSLLGDSADNTIRGNRGNDFIFGGFAAPTATAGDTADYSVATGGVTVDLEANPNSSGADGSDQLSLISNVTGSAFDDTLRGNSSKNTLTAGIGNDLLEGRAGDDTLNGGNGSDTADYSSAGAAVTVDLRIFSPAAQTTGGAGNDTFTRGGTTTAPVSTIENINGSNFGDNLTGDDRDNVLAGLGGSDSLTGRGGNDTASYAAAPGPVVVDFARSAPQQTGAHGDDTLATIESVLGSSFSDTLLGGGNADGLDGGPGDDLLDGRGGPDVLRGGAGFDTASYAERTAAVRVTADGVAADDGEEGEGDNVFADVERLVGGSGNDVLSGSDANNVLEGNAGNDSLIGLGGDDRLIGGAGNDAESGGDGNDLFDQQSSPNGADQFSGGAGTDTVSYSARPTGTAFFTRDNVANDGALDERDNVFSDVEIVTGATAGTARPAGNPNPNPNPNPVPLATQGYTLVGTDGGIFTYGTSQFHGSTGDLKLNQPVVGMANKKGATGYWLVAKDGGIFSFGDAEFFGSAGDLKLNAPILGMEATPSGRGYFLYAEDGGIFTYGDAVFRGSTGGEKLNKPVVGMAVNEKGDGYWLVAQDGGIFSFGRVPFHGSTGDRKLNEPVFDMAPTAGDNGYWLVAKDGGIFSFGDAENKFYGSAVGSTTAPVIGMGATPTFNGYWIADAKGAVFHFGDATFLGDRRSAANNAATVGFATVPKK